MRFIHTADWHLGRYFHGLHLTDEQRELLLGQFLPLVRDEKADVVVIAGDIYDRGIPPVEAVALFDEILTKLIEQKVRVLYIAGNHDSARRIHFGNRLMRSAGVFVRGELEDPLSPVVLEDRFGPVYFQLYPYAEPAAIRAAFGREEQLDFDSATQLLVDTGREQIPAGARSVAVAHAFLAGGQSSESERPLSVGGSGNVSPAMFHGFSYTALGHLHHPQAAGGEMIRYSGSLMKYSFDEAQQHKGVNIVELDGQGQVSRRFQELIPRHDVRRIRGLFADILSDEARYPVSDDFIEVDLKDTRPILDAFNQLKTRYPNLMHILRTDRMAEQVEWQQHGEAMLKQSETELFGQYYEAMKGDTMTDEQQAILSECVSEVMKEAREQG